MVRITKDGNDIAEFAYDALGRSSWQRTAIEIGGQSPPYENNNWQVVAETDANGLTQRWFVYGNYIDEAVMTGIMIAPTGTRLYVQDHLYSPAALVDWNGTVVERYEYDAYGSP